MRRPKRAHTRRLRQYIDSFVEAGARAPDILRGMTTSAARLLDVHKERGSLAPGMAADIIAVPGNPLKDINMLKEVSFVMKDGITYRQVLHPPLVPTISRLRKTTAAMPARVTT